MSDVINTNSSVANNSATSSAIRQKSLHRLSRSVTVVSPADDTGGPAVSMKVCTSRRSSAVAVKIGSTVSLLHARDDADQSARTDSALTIPITV